MLTSNLVDSVTTENNRGTGRPPTPLCPNQGFDPKPSNPTKFHNLWRETTLKVPHGKPQAEAVVVEEAEEAEVEGEVVVAGLGPSDNLAALLPMLLLRTAYWVCSWSCRLVRM